MTDCCLLPFLFLPAAGEREEAPSVRAEAFAMFWNELLELPIIGTDGRPKKIAEAGDVLRLKTSHICGKPREGRHVYVRQSYVDPVDIIMRLVETQRPRHADAVARVQALILGTPGIGKSVFLTFLLWSIIQRYRGKDIAIVYRSGTASFLALMSTSSKGVDACNIDANRTAPQRYIRAALKPNNWVLLDACPHIGGPESVAHAVMVTSPDNDLYNEYKKYASVLWMPVWDWTELSDCRLKVFKDTISQEWLERVAEASGPIPLPVFGARAHDANTPVRQIQIATEHAIPKGLNQLSDIVGEVCGIKRTTIASHRIVHCWVSDNFYSESNPMSGYRLVKTRFASPYVEKTTMDRLVKAQLDDIKRVVSGQTADENLRKTIFESWAHVTIPMGGQRYKIKRLDGPAPGTEDVVTFPTMKTRRFWNLRDFVNEPLANGEYAQPVLPTLGTVDSLVKPDILFQMTVVAGHPIKAALLVDAIDAIDPPGTPPPTPGGQQPVERIETPIDCTSSFRKGSGRHSANSLIIIL